MPQKIMPLLESKYGWAFGESGWNVGMDENILKFSSMITRVIDGVVESLPVADATYKSYFLTTDNRLYFSVDSIWYSSPVPQWFTLILKSTGQPLQFNGTALVELETAQEVAQNLSAFQNSLGTAAYQDSSFFVQNTDFNSFKTSTENSITQVQNSVAVSFEKYGAVGDGVADDTTAIQAALNDTSVNYFETKPGKTYNITSLTLSRSNVEIRINAGSTINCQNPTARSITISGSNCNIVGPGTIKGQPVFDGANVRPTYAMLWVTGNYLTVRDVTFDTVPKEAVMFEDSTYHVISGCRFLGRYPQSSYDENTTTNHCAILSNIPDSVTHVSPYIRVINNSFEGFIQGVLSLNYGAAGNNTGVLVSGNTFKNCWDHGVYMSRGLAHNIVGNTFLDCRRPIVSDGVGSIVVGNTLYSTINNASNGEQMVSVRESSYSVISSNTIYGKDASIFLDNIETPDCVGNIISNNIIRQTGVAFSTSCIRMNGAQVCSNNRITGNSVEASSLGSANYLVDVSILAGFFGSNNYITDNILTRSDVGGAIRLDRHNRCQIKDNKLIFTGATNSTVTLNAILSTNSAYLNVESNLINYKTGGGSGVTVNAVNVDAGGGGSLVRRNIIDIQVTINGVAQIISPSGIDLKENTMDSSSPMAGKFTVAVGATTLVVSNLNVRPSSIITINPLNSAAASLIATAGVWVTASTQTFTFNTTSETTASCEFSYTIY